MEMVRQPPDLQRIQFDRPINMFYLAFTVELLATYARYGTINVYLPNPDSYVMCDIKLPILLFCLIFCQEVEAGYLGQL